MSFKAVTNTCGVPGEKIVNIPQAGGFVIDKVKEEIRMIVIPAYFMPDEYNKEADENGNIKKEVLKNSGTNLNIVISGDAYHKWMKDMYGETKKHFESFVDC